MEKYCLMTKTHYKLKEGTRTVWVIDEEPEIKEIDKQWYDNVVDAKNFFKSLGGKEIHKKNGNLVTKIISIRPDREVKVIYEFKFD